MLFWILAIALHVVAIYAGCSIAQLEYVDIGRSAVIAAISYVVMLLVAIPLGMVLALVPILRVFIGAAILLLGTTVAAKMVLSVEWKEAWIIGGTAAVANALASWFFSGCA
jgi:hypothetical protein